MDWEKVGKLIFQLRKEKKMTQQQLGDKINVSNKTVSKWERGLGLPDASLWSALSEVLNADIGKMLSGELEPNPSDIGNISKTRFFVCPSCGNILTSTGAVSIACCGRILEEAKVNKTSEKYKFNIEDTDVDYYMSVEHEMTKAHYISFMAFVKSDKMFLNRMYPEQMASTHVPSLSRGGKVYIYCVQHGLNVYTWKEIVNNKSK